MEHFIDIYNKRPDLVEKLLSLNDVKVNIKLSGKPLQVLVEDGRLYYYGSSKEHLALEIDEYTKLFSKPINHAISVIEENKELYLNNYRYYSFETLDNKLFLISVIDDNNQFIESTQDIKTISECLEIEAIPTLWEGKLTEEQVDSIVNILESGIVPDGKEFINWLKEQFGSYEFFPESLDNNIEGITLSFEAKDKIAEYDLINPAYTELVKERKEREEEITEKNKSIYESIYNIFVSFAENTNWNKSKNKLQNLQENFEEMMSNPKTYNKLINLGSKLTLNESSIQVNMLNESLSKDIYRKGKVYKNLFENFVKLFYKPKEKGFIISKEFQNRVNNILI